MEVVGFSAAAGPDQSSGSWAVTAPQTARRGGGLWAAPGRYSRPTPSKRQNIELLVGWLDALIRGDEQAVAAALHPDVVWRGLRPEWGCAGAASVAATFMDARGAQADIDSIELIGAEQHAIMRVCWPQILREEGRHFLTGVYNVFAIADRRITRIDDHEDRAAALAAAGIGG